MRVMGNLSISGKFTTEQLQEFVAKLPGVWNIEIKGDKINLTCSYTIG